MLVFASPAVAQYSQLDDIAAQFVKKFKNENAKTVAVADFTAADGSPSEQGEYFASFVAARLNAHDKQLRVAERKWFMDFLEHQGIDSRGPLSLAALHQISSQAAIDYVLEGTVETDADSYAVHLMARRVKDGSLLIEKSTRMRRTEFTDSLSEKFPPQSEHPIRKLETGQKETPDFHLPICIHCRQPDYTDFARSQKFQGISKFEILISRDGRVLKVHCKKPAGYALDESAFNTIKKWKFKPATSEDGTPIDAIVDVEVSFSLY
jgi:TonB family protein